MSSLDGNASHSASPVMASAVSRYMVAWMLLFAVVAVITHGLVLNAIGSGNGGEPPEHAAISQCTWLFAGVGLAFLTFTWLSHLPLAQMLRGHDRVPSTQSSSAKTPELGPLAGLLVSMAIRLTGTFAILGLLWKAEFVSREEAVFNVLFWYVTLTAMEVVGIVWASRSFVCSSPLGDVPAANESECITLKS